MSQVYVMKTKKETKYESKVKIEQETKTKRIIKERCPECLDTRIITDVSRGERICRNCGLVIHDRMVSEEAKDNYKAISRSRPLQRHSRWTMHDKGLSTMPCFEVEFNNLIRYRKK